MITKEVQQVLEFKRSVLHNKWSIEVILILGDGYPLRFNEIQDNLPGCSAKVLTDTLKRLLAQEIIIRESFNEIPPRVTYELSSKGKQVLKYVEESIKFFSSVFDFPVV